MTGRTQFGVRRAARLVGVVGLVAVAVAASACAPVAEEASGAAGAGASVGASGSVGLTTRPEPTADRGAGPVPLPEPPAPPLSVRFEPAPNAQDVRPDTAVRVGLLHGRLTAMTVTSPSGPVPGAFTGGHFTPAQPLGFGQTYTVTATGVPDAGGEATTFRSVFTTLVPGAEISAEIFPTDGEVVGVGMPVIVEFSSPVPVEARAALTARVAVSSVPAVEGGWRWLNETTMHWRPRTYWPAGTAVSVTAGVAGVGVGDEWFTTSPSRSFTIGPDHRITIDAGTHQMVAYENGQPIRAMAISTGNDAYPTASGIDLIMEKHALFEMDSTSVGITGADAYLVTVADAQRLTYSGTFIHAAPWNNQLGVANTSHGCVNASEADAAWMMDFTLIGDPVEITGTPERVSWGNGWGDWNIPWEEWPGIATD